jgi:hypothetical protein
VFVIRRLGDRFSWFEGLNVGVLFSCCVRQIPFFLTFCLEVLAYSCIHLGGHGLLFLKLSALQHHLGRNHLRSWSRAVTSSCLLCLELTRIGALRLRQHIVSIYSYAFSPSIATESLGDTNISLLGLVHLNLQSYVSVPTKCMYICSRPAPLSFTLVLILFMFISKLSSPSLLPPLNTSSLLEDNH